MKPEKVYEIVKDLSEPFIQYYKKDLLEIDKQSIEGNEENAPFIHFTGTSGTYLFYFPNPESPKVKNLFGYADRNEIIEGQANAIRGCRGSDRQSLILYYNGTQVMKITQDAAEHIAKEYVLKTKNAWDKLENSK